MSVTRVRHLCIIQALTGSSPALAALRRRHQPVAPPAAAAAVRRVGRVAGSLGSRARELTRANSGCSRPGRWRRRPPAGRRLPPTPHPFMTGGWVGAGWVGGWVGGWGGVGEGGWASPRLSSPTNPFHHSPAAGPALAGNVGRHPSCRHPAAIAPPIPHQTLDAVARRAAMPLSRDGAAVPPSPPTLTR